jgi:ubiquinone biosynthesis protein
MVFDYEGVPLKDIRVGNVIRQFAGIVREHSIVLPSDLSLMFKALITLEGLGRQYDPEFHITEHLTPLVKDALAARYQPTELMRRGRSTVSEFMSVVGGVPRDLARFLREARRGKTRIDLDLKRLDSFGRQLDRTLDRVAVGILTASLVIGSAIVLTVRDGPTLWGIPVLPAMGMLGYILAFLNSLWIVYGIWRSGRE